MEFPFTKTGSFEVEVREGDPRVMLQIVRERFLNWLHKKSAETSVNAAGNIEFQAGLTRISWAGNPLCAVTLGDISMEVVHRQVLVKYKLRFTQALVLVSVPLSLWTGASILALEAPAFLAGCIGWLWLFGGNYVLSSFGVRRGLAKAALRD